MSDYVDEPLPESDEEVVDVNEVEEEEEPVPVEVEEEVAEVEEEEAPANEVAEVEEPAPANEVAEVEEPVSTQEVVQNVQEMLTTEPAVSSDSASLEERVKVLEERLEKLIEVLKSSWISNTKQGKCREYLNNSLSLV